MVGRSTPATQYRTETAKHLTSCFLCSFLSPEERLRIGRLCKRLIDGGRLHFLKARGFNGKLSYYVSSQVTLENVLLVAAASSSTTSSATSSTTTL